MKLVQINRYDVVGERFNGFAVRQELKRRGIDSTHLVWERSSDEPESKTFLPVPGVRKLNEWIVDLERRRSTQAMLQAHTFALPLQRSFIEADVVHYHIIHDGYFSMRAMPWLSSLKPSVWTWHDPWPMTGHCIHPKGCRRWLTGCGECPDLTAHFAMQDDRTAEAFREKKDLFARSNLDVVVASSWMLNMAKASPIAANARLHLVPFGIDLDLYRPADKAALKRKFGIEPNRVVIALRAQSSIFKGLEPFVQAMEQIDTQTPITILAVQETGHMDHLLGRHQIVEVGWVKEHAAMAEVMAAADLFVMPSTAESFGMMAVEAMACGAPVVVFEGTALPEVVGAPNIGVATPLGDATALAEAIKRLVENPDELRARGERARAFAEREYSLGLHIDRISKVYETAVDRRRAPSAAA